MRKALLAAEKFNRAVAMQVRIARGAWSPWQHYIITT
jgi:hypothetical protein